MSDPAPLYETTEAPVPPGAEPAWLSASDGVRLRVALYPVASPRGTVVLSPGRTEPIEKYHEVIGELPGHRTPADARFLKDREVNAL